MDLREIWKAGLLAMQIPRRFPSFQFRLACDLLELKYLAFQAEAFYRMRI